MRFVRQLVPPKGRPGRWERWLGRWTAALPGRRRREERLFSALRRLRRANRRLRLLAGLDGLTGLANRRAFEQRLRGEWSRACRAGEPLALLMVDVDRFKAFNDSRGHLAGDAILKKVAAALAGTLRRPGDLAARFGGEEFALLLPHTDLSGAAVIAEAVRAAVSAVSPSREDGVTISVGAVSWVPDRRAEPEDLVAAADQALYRAKAQGRDRVSMDWPSWGRAMRRSAITG